MVDQRRLLLRWRQWWDRSWHRVTSNKILSFFTQKKKKEKEMKSVKMDLRGLKGIEVALEHDFSLGWGRIRRRLSKEFVQSICFSQLVLCFWK